VYRAPFRYAATESRGLCLCQLTCARNEDDLQRDRHASADRKQHNISTRRINKEQIAISHPSFCAHTTKPSVWLTQK